MILPLVIFFTTSLTSCDPHRRGSVIKGSNAKQHRHHRPASSKDIEKININ